MYEKSVIKESISAHPRTKNFIIEYNQINIQVTNYLKGQKMKKNVFTILLVLVLTACASPAPTTSPTSVPVQPTAIPVQPTSITAKQTQAPSVATALPAEIIVLDGATLLETRCSVCHSADRPKQAKKTHDQWDQTVGRMIGKGAKLTEAEKTVLVDYLTKTYGQ